MTNEDTEKLSTVFAEQIVPLLQGRGFVLLVQVPEKKGAIRIGNMTAVDLYAEAAQGFAAHCRGVSETTHEAASKKLAEHWPAAFGNEDKAAGPAGA